VHAPLWITGNIMRGIPFSSNMTGPEDNFNEEGADYFDGSVPMNLGFGVALSDNGDIAVAGATKNFVVIYNGCTSSDGCTQTQVLTRPEPLETCSLPDECNTFGRRVALSGDGKVLAVSSPKSRNYCGAVHIYRTSRAGVFPRLPTETVTPPTCGGGVGGGMLNLLEFGQAVEVCVMRRLLLKISILSV
jgi:hypothetical protein